MWKKGRVDSIPTDVSINQGSGIEIESERVERKKRGKVGNGALFLRSFLSSAPRQPPSLIVPRTLCLSILSLSEGASTDK